MSDERKKQYEKAIKARNQELTNLLEKIHQLGFYNIVLVARDKINNNNPTYITKIVDPNVACGDIEMAKFDIQMQQSVKASCIMPNG